MATRQLKLGAFMRPASIHTGAWRYPGAWPDVNFNFAHMRRCIQTLERAKFDAFFMADHMAVLNMPIEALKRSHTVTSFEPFTLLSALSQVTEHIGLVATGSTTFDAPYHIARRFASLDHLSGGRAGWNIVTTSNPDAALNFGLDEHMEHGERYERAREFYDVVTGLWDSWADDAFIRDVENGIFFDPDKMHVLDHKGEYLSVRGPLNIARPVQGWPVIVQAGASEAGTPARGRDRGGGVHRAVAASRPGRAFYADVKGRMEKLGRARDHMKILPACFVVVGDTVEEAREKRAQARQPRPLRQRHRLALDRARPRCLEVRSGRAAARDPREQPEQERPRARDRAGASARTSPCASSRSGSAAIRGSPWSARADHRRRDGGMARDRRLRRLHRSCSPICPAGSTISAARWCRNCSGAACSGANTRARRCARISACRGRRTGSFS